MRDFYIKTIQCLKDNKQVILSNGHMRVGSGVLKTTQCSLMWLQGLIGLNIPSNSWLRFVIDTARIYRTSKSKREKIH